VVIHDRVHVDGGIASAVSFELARLPDHLVVAVDVVGMPVGDPLRIPGRLEAALGASQLMMQASTRLKLAQWQPDILIRPPVNEFRVLDFLRARTIIERTGSVRAELRDRLSALLAG
jgi:NTE family protein